MILILDGYNILKQIFASSHVTSAQRDSFVRLLGKYASKKNHKIILFFDGGTYEKPYESRLNGITMWYSGYHLTADDLIIQHAPVYKNKDAALVTSDRELINQTSSYFKTTFEPSFFYQQVKSLFQPTVDTSSTPFIIKTSEEDNKELDALMHEAALLPTLFKDDIPDPSPSKHTTLSKKERLLQKKKKKL